MALFKKNGDSLSRASAILSTLAPKGDEGKDDKVVDPVPTPEPSDQGKQDTPQPPAEGQEGGKDTPPDEGGSVTPPEGGTATPPEGTDTVDPVAPKAPEKVEIEDSLIFEKLSEMLGKEVKSADDLKVEAPQLDPEIEQLLKWKEDTGLSLTDWTKYNKDFSKMSDLEVAKEILAQKFPNLTKEELEYSLSDYIYNEDVDEDRDKLRKSIALKKLAQEGREALEAKKLELVANKGGAVLTKEQQDAIKFAQDVSQERASAIKAQEEYSRGIAQASGSLEHIEMKLGDDLTIKYTVPGEVKKGLPKMVAEMPHWYNPDGSYNHSNVVKDVAKVMNFDAIVKAAYDQGVEVGKEGQIKRSANITIDGVPTPDSGKPQKGNVDDVVDKIAGPQRRKLRFRGAKS